MPLPKFQSKCGQYWLQPFRRRDAQGNWSVGYTLGINGGTSHTFEFQRQAAARACFDVGVEAMFGKINWGLTQDTATRDSEG